MSCWERNPCISSCACVLRELQEQWPIFTWKIYSKTINNDKWNTRSFCFIRKWNFYNFGAIWQKKYSKYKIKLDNVKHKSKKKNVYHWGKYLLVFKEEKCPFAYYMCLTIHKYFGKVLTWLEIQFPRKVEPRVW